MTVHGNCLTIARVNLGIPDEELDAAMERLRPRYQRMLENLAK